MEEINEPILTPSEVQAIIDAGFGHHVPFADFARLVEAAVLEKLRRHDIEETIEQAWQQFIAMRDGTGEFAGEAWPERDAFKAHVRRFAYARYRELMAQVVRDMQGGLPERDPAAPAEQQGLFRKFEVRRVDGSDAPGGKHHGCLYFVLDIDHDPHARAALRAYADACATTHPELARDLLEKWGVA